MQKKTFFFAGIVLCLLILAATAFYLYQKPRAGLTDIKPAYTLSAKELYSAFERDEKKANQQFLGKVIRVKGTVGNIQVIDSTISLLLSSGSEMGGINCSVRKARDDRQILPAKGSLIEVKGRCTGFLMDVNLVDVLIVPATST